MIETTVLDLVLAHDGDVALFRRLIDSSSRLRLVGELAPEDNVLDTMLAQHPEAAVVVTTRFASGEPIADKLARLQRRGLVEGALSPSIMLTLPPSAEVQVAHGWVTLPGRLWLERLLSLSPPTRVRIEVSGIPSGQECELDEVVENATALLVRLFPGSLSFQMSQRHEDALELSMRADTGVEVDLLLAVRRPRFDIRLEGHAFHARYSLKPGVEHFTLDRNGRRDERSRPLPSSAERALAQLLDPNLGDSMANARRGWELAAKILEDIPYRAGISRRALALASSYERTSGLGLEALGLRGSTLPRSRDRVDFFPPSVLPPIPLELVGVLADIKPVAFLTVAPSELGRALKSASGLAIERRDRRVRIDESQDAWIDRRDQGRPFIELYISRDSEKAKRAAKLQAEGDPTADMVELGELLGYPICCIRAFASQRDRSNNTLNRYASFAKTKSEGPWPFQLSNFWDTLTPFFPCRYDCAAGLSYSKRSLEAVESHHPGTLARVEDALSHPTLYFTHGVSLILRHGSSSREGQATRVRGYSAVGVRRGGSVFEHDFASLLATGDEIELAPTSLTLFRSGRPVASLDRVGPRLGFIAPFGKASDDQAP